MRMAILCSRSVRFLQRLLSAISATKPGALNWIHHPGIVFDIRHEPDHGTTRGGGCDRLKIRLCGFMREVIRRKPLWRNKLETYVAEAYTRQRPWKMIRVLFPSPKANRAFSGIASADRVRSCWPVNKHPTWRWTRILQRLPWFPIFMTMTSKYPDFDMIGVTHPDALRYYYFELDGIRELDGQPVYDISGPSPKKAATHIPRVKLPFWVVYMPCWK